MPVLSSAEDLRKYFRDGPYAFEIRFGKGTFQEFYQPSPQRNEILANRRELLARFADRHVRTMPGGAKYLEEVTELARSSDIVPAETRPENLGREWEADFLLLEGGRLVYGCVCFPSSWDLGEKIGRPVEEIHSVVPGLNNAIGRQIATFLERLKPGVSWTRSNWGLSRHAALNQHPALKLSRLDSTARMEEVFFRVEEQSLFALPRTGGVLFGIRVKVFPLALLAANAETANGLRVALETMPEEMARYKGIAAARERIIDLLRTGAENHDRNGAE